MLGYLKTKIKSQCYGCEACVQACPKNCINMLEDEEGFRYPSIMENDCIHCGNCSKVCPHENIIEFYQEEKIVFGGYNKNTKIKAESTSGGAFSALVDAWCNKNYVIFGAEADGLNVYHSYIEDKKDLYKFRKSKYSQSVIGNSYKNVKLFLGMGKKVLFSGTPCQIAGLKSYLSNVSQENLLTIEVVCEGVPTPYFIRKYDEWLSDKYNEGIQSIDYRYKDMKTYKKIGIGKWDFQVMYIQLKNNKRIKMDRWVNPFWSIWLNHLMSRPSCYECQFAVKDRCADITLGDLWGVHLYCPELYGKNAGTSLVVCNSEKGKKALELAQTNLYGHLLKFDEAQKYQSPMRKHIDYNQRREDFMKDIKCLGYEALCKKWAIKPGVKLLFEKYIWGNRQKVAFWKVKNMINGKR